MDTLNEDCIVQILQYLSLKDQIAVLLSNESLIDILGSMWKIKYKRQLLLKLKAEMPIEIYELKQFLRVVHPYIENLQLELESKNMISVLNGFKFIKTSNLYITVGSSEMLEHEFVTILHDIFPNVKVLQPNGKFTGAGFAMWKSLEQLTLTSCYIFRFHYLERILQELPLNTLILKSFKMKLPRLAENALQYCRLRVLILSSYELSYFTPQLKNLQHLKELYISDLFSTANLDSLHKKLGEMHHTRHIEGIYTRDITTIFPKIINCRMHTHLRRLILAVDPLAFSDMLIYICLLPTLRVLHFHACYVRSELDFQKLFLVSAHLDEISLEGCIISYGSNPSLNVNEVVENRTKPITLNFYANKLDDENKMAELQITGRSNLFILECEQKLKKRCGYLVYEFG
uniref:Putative F-box protein R638 n=2 Tax=Zeugodacus cucurbitae TaxID=28588 RepID=A0A0A1XQ31_ZEUCU